MNISAQSTKPAHDLIAALYQSVDTKDLDGLGALLCDGVVFQLGNHPKILGKAAVVAANSDFFGSIQSMSHQIDEIWQRGEQLMCAGSVFYTRLDGSNLSVPFATILGLEAGLIATFQVYVDVSGL